MAFFNRLHDGRNQTEFLNSLKNVRDRFDGYHDTGRVGWRETGSETAGARAPKLLGQHAAAIMQEWSVRSDKELWETVKYYVQTPSQQASIVAIHHAIDRDSGPIQIDLAEGVAQGPSLSKVNRRLDKPRTRPELPIQETQLDQVTASVLSEWRRSLVRLLKSLDTGQDELSTDGPAQRIDRLSRSGILPREIGALMRVVTEMRNSSEYDSKILSKYESVAGRSAWSAISEWVETRNPKR